MRIIFLISCIFSNNILDIYQYRSVIGIGRYEKCFIGILSVSADMKIGFISEYRYWQIWKNPYRLYTVEVILKFTSNYFQ